jgi:carbamate kinase
MRIVAALGGNALLERGEPAECDIQEAHVQKAAAALAPLARSHNLVVTHGNGPQVGMLAIESAGDPALAHPYPFDTLGAQTQGMIGYWLAQALRNAVPGREVACLVSQTLVSAADPAFASPSKLVGPVYDESHAGSPRPMDGTSGKTAPGGGGSSHLPNRPNCSTSPSSASCTPAA